MIVLEGRAFYRDSLEPLALGIEDGRIVQVAKTLKGDERRDYGDRLLLPGGVDLHVHFRDPGGTHREDFASGTAAAAVGGVTTVTDMPNTDPPVTSRGAYREKLEMVRSKANVDFGLYAAIRSVDDVHSFAKVVTAGKMYMAHSAGRIEVTEEAAWREIVAAVGETGLLLSAHAEHPAHLAPSPAASLEGHHRARPPEAEAAAIRALGDAAKALAKPPRVHIAHVSTRAGLEALEGTGLTSEATPHHLFLDCARPLKTLGKVNPPLRPVEDRDALWAALVDGRIDCVASDHAPRTITEKGADFASAQPGVPGVETMLPLLLLRVKRGDLTVERFVDVAARRPAEILGIDGVLDVGKPANLIVVDGRDIATIRARDLHSLCGWTPFEGFQAVFPQATYLRGELVAEGRELVAERLGRPVERA